MILCAVQFVVVLDVTIVATALPAVRSDLGFSDAGLAWVVTVYTVVLGVLLVPGGRVADVIGPRRALVTGLGIFVAASVTCATAWTPAALVAARAVQGLGAALLAPAALALLAVCSPSARQAARAVGWWTAAGAIGGGSGWVLGGVLTDNLGWPAVFWVNVPIGLAAIAGAVVALPVVPPRRGHRALPRLRPMAGANLTAALLTASTTPAMYLAMLHLQEARGLTAARAAVLFPVFNVGVVVGSLVSTDRNRTRAGRDYACCAAGRLPCRFRLRRGGGDGGGRRRSAPTAAVDLFGFPGRPAAVVSASESVGVGG